MTVNRFTHFTLLLYMYKAVGDKSMKVFLWPLRPSPAGGCSIILPVEVRYIQTKCGNALLHKSDFILTSRHSSYNNEIYFSPVRHRHYLKNGPWPEFWCSVRAERRRLQGSNTCDLLDTTGHSRHYLTDEQDYTCKLECWLKVKHLVL